MILKRTLNVATNTLLTRYAAFAPSLACMATGTSSARTAQRLCYLVLFLNVASKRVTKIDVL
ncbi:hypothetical protein N7499_008086 [Penicillium canescens]|uniref:Uncharacterized protein n=1 Tax=Penicillium canescens TaxID=5083 RepID=A0AAD6HYE8_PENCN|nr:uncharacterized protein N7446_013121 [Penicillium canescens]KAJ5985626.1 hypothetical protein N7522_012822 [Penicillium canescens]KAJ6022769.1 hypothetical protein N7460_013164 [Penicillium canescens]KAJ6025968.1 hypothetical protein N7444_013647 [Penicillium canescens]KAJ6042055.1 hypothetical protein N7446_013121 [Penicillium canescens]KAJ6076105.1 hypothetical protein N7499_008086 [Penicillium canescens]